MSRILALTFGALVLAASANAQSPLPQNPLFGQADLAGGERLRVPGCGRMGGAVAFDLVIGNDGAWTLDTGSATYTGTSTRRGHTALLTFDPASLGAFEAALEADAAALCEEAVDITALRTHALVVVNKRATRAHFFWRAAGRGTTASGEDGHGVYKARTRGAWTPAPAL
jgi:hypothetical protein